MSDPRLDLHQRRLIEVREVRVEEHHVVYREKTFRNDAERRIPFEEIFPELRFEKQSLDGLTFVFALASLLFATFSMNSSDGKGPNWLLASVWMLCFIGSTIACFVRSGRTVEIPVLNQKPVILFRSIPDPDNVENFIDEMTLRLREYLRHKYGMVNFVEPVEQQVQRITWLRDRNHFSNVEYAEAIDKLESMFKPVDERPIGFIRDRNSAKGSS